MPKPTRKLRVPIAAALLLLACIPRLGAQTDLPLDVQVPLLLRVLAYDRALDRSGDGDVVVAVLYDAASTASSESRSAFARAVRGGKITTVNGRTIRLVEINVAAGQVDAALRRNRAVAAYLTAGLDARVDQLVAAGGASRTLMMTGNSEWVRRGVPVGVGTAGGRPQLVINLPSARGAGADLPSSLLQIATVVQ
ncbi:MAG TPA: YfiR family protein [Longimicrobiaceae bacterium]|nr:YfiR family protein [Longimicrobiaceae bacterium]